MASLRIHIHKRVVETSIRKVDWSQLVVVLSVGFLFSKYKEPLKLFIRKMTYGKGTEKLSVTVR